MNNKLRLLIGCSFIISPFVLELLSKYRLMSISGSYYHNTRDLFMVILSAFGAILLNQQWKTIREKLIYYGIGFSSIGMGVFPTKYYAHITTIGVFNLPVKTSYIIHLTFSIVFFSLLIIDCFLFINFKDMCKNKFIKNIIYCICLIGIVASFITMLLTKAYFITETIILILIGICWVLKSNMVVFKDETN